MSAERSGCLVDGFEDEVVRLRKEVARLRTELVEARRAERRYRRLVEQLPIITYVDALDPLSSNLYTSPQVTELLGYTVEEWQDDPELFVKLLHPDDRERVLAEVARSNERGGAYRTEYRLIARDGRVVWLRDESVAIPAMDGEPAQCQGYLLDITDRKRAEEQALEKAQALEALIEASPAAIVGFSADGAVTLWNPAAERMFGWTADEVLGRFNPLEPERHRSRFLEFIARALAGETWRDVEITRRGKSGQLLHLSASSAPLRDGSGKSVGVVSILVDITERVVAERRLRASQRAIRASEEQFRTLIANIPGAVYRCRADHDWTMDYVSDDIEEICGYPAWEFLGNAVRSYASVIYEEDCAAVRAAVKAAIQERRPFIIEYRIVRADGEIRWVYEKGQPILGPDGRVLWLDGVIFDITDRRKVEEERERLLAAEQAAREQLAEQNERLRELDRLKDEFVALVSHELRTPLTSILGYLDLIVDEGGLDATQLHYLEIVRRNADRLLQLVGDLLFVAQIDAGKLALELAPVDLAAVAQECIETMGPKASEKRITLELTAQDTPVIGDRLRLGQLLENLVSNAVKFTPEGGRVAVDVRPGSRGAVITVTDTGIGISEADQARLFERFFRTETATRLAIQGTGLGLTICKAIAEAHGGVITVESGAGQGTTFRVELPQAADSILAAA